MSRASFANDEKDVEDEVNRAISHIERANRDCLKVSVLEQHDRLKSSLADIRFFHGFITPAIKSKYYNIMRLRKISYEDEVRGDKNAAEKLETLLRFTNELVEEIDDTYIGIGLKRGRLRRLVQQWFRPVAFMVVTFVGAVIGYIARGYIGDITMILFNR